MGQTYGLDELDTTRTTSTFATVQDMIRDYDFGNQNGHVLVHTETVEYRDAEDSMDMETGFGVAKWFWLPLSPSIITALHAVINMLSACVIVRFNQQLHLARRAGNEIDVHVTENT